MFTGIIKYMGEIFRQTDENVSKLDAVTAMRCSRNQRWCRISRTFVDHDETLCRQWIILACLHSIPSVRPNVGRVGGY
jgi:hypothetical protein